MTDRKQSKYPVSLGVYLFTENEIRIPMFIKPSFRMSVAGPLDPLNYKVNNEEVLFILFTKETIRFGRLPVLL